MTLGLLAIAAALLAIAAYLAALNRSLLSLSQTALLRRLEAMGRHEKPEWLFAHLDEAILATAFLRTAARMGFFALVLGAFAGLGGSAVAELTWSDLLISGAVSVVILWAVTTVISSAFARYNGTALVHLSLPLIHILTFICWPLTWTTRSFDRWVRRLTGAHRRPDEPEEDLLIEIEDKTLGGELDEAAAEMLGNVVEFTTTQVSEVMTPRTDIQAIECTDDLDRVRAALADAGHSRIPVYRSNLDHILGIIYVKDLVPWVGRNGDDFRLEPLLRQPIVVPESKPVRELLADFQRSEVHMAIIIDEYGGTQGLVTIEDLLEEIVGEIRDEHEPEEDDEPRIRPLGDDRYEVDGRYRIHELNDELNIELPEDEDYDTVAGFVLAQLGRVPAQGETIPYKNLQIIALNVTPKHIETIAIERLGTSSAAATKDDDQTPTPSEAKAS